MHYNRLACPDAGKVAIPGPQAVDDTAPFVVGRAGPQDRHNKVALLVGPHQNVLATRLVQAVGVGRAAGPAFASGVGRCRLAVDVYGAAHDELLRPPAESADVSLGLPWPVADHVDHAVPGALARGELILPVPPSTRTLMRPHDDPNTARGPGRPETSPYRKQLTGIQSCAPMRPTEDREVDGP